MTLTSNLTLTPSPAMYPAVSMPVQVKVGGVRMELGEIEAVTLREVPELLNVAVEKIDDSLVGVAAPRPGKVQLYIMQM